MRIALPALLMMTIGAPAVAQVSDTLPRFEALEQQQQMNEQRQLDSLEAERQRTLDRAALPGSGVTAAQRAQTDMEFDRQREQLLLEARNRRAQQQRERDIAEAALPNRRVPAHSSAVISDPERYILPPAPPNQYYARVDGRFVLVDKSSELVTSVLPVQPTDPVADVPAGPSPMSTPGLPVRRIAPTSSLVIANYGALSLPEPPRGQYYARVDGSIVLVDGRTELAVRIVRPA